MLQCSDGTIPRFPNPPIPQFLYFKMQMNMYELLALTSALLPAGLPGRAFLSLYEPCRRARSKPSPLLGRSGPSLCVALPNKSALPAAVVHLQPASNGWQSYEVHIMVTHLFLAGDHTSIEERRHWKSRKVDLEPGE